MYFKVKKEKDRMEWREICERLSGIKIMIEK